MNELIQEILSGNVEGFSRLVGAYERGIYSYLYKLCNNKEDALDLTQVTFIKVYNSLNRLKSDDNIKPWIYRIAHNSFIDYLRSKKESQNIDECEFVYTVTPEDLVISKYMIKSINEIISSLPYEYKSVFILRAAENLSFREIGFILKLSESTARCRYLRARRKIASILNGGELL